MTNEDGCAVESHTSSMFMAHWGSASLLKGGMEGGGAGILEATGWVLLPWIRGFKAELLKPALGYGKEPLSIEQREERSKNM